MKKIIDIIVYNYAIIIPKKDVNIRWLCFWRAFTS